MIETLLALASRLSLKHAGMQHPRIEFAKEKISEVLLRQQRAMKAIAAFIIYSQGDLRESFNLLASSDKDLRIVLSSLKLMDRDLIIDRIVPAEKHPIFLPPSDPIDESDQLSPKTLRSPGTLPFA